MKEFFEVKSHFSDEFPAQNECPPCVSLPPVGAGAHAILGITGMPDPGNTAPSQPGRRSGGAKPPERQHFSSMIKEHFSGVNSGSVLLTMFSLVSSCPDW